MAKQTVRGKKAKQNAAAAKAADRSGVSPNAWRFVNRQQIAELLGVSADTVTDWTSQKDLPVAHKGGHSKKSVYDAVAVMTWHRKQTSSKTIDAKEIAQTRAYVAQAELNELKLMRERGEVVPRDVVTRDVRSFGKGLAGKMRSLSRRLVQIGAVPREQEAAAVELVREIMTDISAWTTAQDADAAAEESA